MTYQTIIFLLEVMTMSKKPSKGCINCKYSAISYLGEKHCGRKAGFHRNVSDDEWLKNKCEKWEYDDVSDGFDKQEEYDKLPNEC